MREPNRIRTSSAGVLRCAAWGLVVASLVVIFACSERGESALDQIEREGFVRAGYTHEPPYAFLDSAGDVRGESPLALRGALAGLPADSVRWVRLEFDELLPALAEGRVDVVSSGLFPTEERSRTVVFTRPTTCSRAALLTRAGTARFSGLAAFTDPDAGTLAVTRGAVEERAARELGVPDERVVAVPDLPTGIGAVREGLATAFAMTVPTLRGALSRESDTSDLVWYEYEPDGAVASLVQGCSALAVRPREEALLEALNRGLERYVGSDAHRRALAELGFGADDLPPPREEER